MSDQLKLYVILLAVAAAESFTLSALVWRGRRQGRAVLPFSLMMLALGIWAAGYAVELTLNDVSSGMLAAQIEYIGIATVPIFFLILVLIQTGREQWLTRRNTPLLFAIPITTLLLIWTNESHHLIYQSLTFSIDNGIAYFTPVYGLWFWIHFVYSYLALLVGVIFLVVALIRSPNLYRGQAATLMLGALAPVIGNILYFAHVGPFMHLDPTPFAFLITGLAFSWSILSFHLLDLLPVARDKAVQNMVDAVIVLDTDNRVVDLNPVAERILNTSLSKAIGVRLIEVVPAQRDLLVKFANIEETHTEITVKTRDGADRVFELNITPLKDRGGSISGRLVMLHDITAQKGAEKALERAHEHALEALQVKSRILAIVSHDFRTPLSSIAGYVYLLQNGQNGALSEDQKGYLNRIKENVKELSDLVTHLLDQAQLDDSQITLNLGRFTPTDLTERLESLIGLTIREKGLGFRFEIDPKLADKKVFGDLPRLQQVLSNILTNALKFTETGEIVVRVYLANDSQWGVEVRDTGPGMPSEIIAHIFDPFWQGDGSITREYRGVGLGLSIAKQLTHMMSGNIDVESTVGKGSIFRVLLPTQITGGVKREKEISGTDH